MTTTFGPERPWPPPLTAPVAPYVVRAAVLAAPPAAPAPAPAPASAPDQTATLPPVADPAVPTKPATPAEPTAPIKPAGPEVLTEFPELPKHDLPVLEAFRGIAALMVVVTHVGFTAGDGTRGAWAGWLSRLDFGVALFFLLSGFLLFRPFVQAAYGTRPAVDVRAYIQRRYVRIYPALLLVMAVNFLLTPQARDGQRAPLSLWLQTLFLVQNYPSDFINQLPGLVQTWSLVVEVSFYLFLPVLAWMILGRATSLASATSRAARRPEPATSTGSTGSTGSTADSTAASIRPAAAAPVTRRAAREAQKPSASKRLLGADIDPVRLAAWRPAFVLGAMVVIALTWRISYAITSDGYARQLLWLPAFLDWFAAGMALAWLRERPAPLPEPIRILANMPGVCWSLALAGYWLVTTGIGGPYGLTGATTGSNITKHVTYLIVATLLLLPAVFGDRRASWRGVATHPIMTWLGRISFGVFLWHPMLMESIRRVLRIPDFGGGFWLTLTLTMISSMIAGTLSWKYLEEPLQRRWRHGFGIQRTRDSRTIATSSASSASSV